MRGKDKMKKNANASMIEQIVIRIEERFSDLENSFAEGNIPLVKVNSTSQELLFRYRQEARESLVGFAGCKNLKRDYDTRVNSAYDKLRDSVDNILAGATQ
jgi:hypothetical protein